MDTEQLRAEIQASGKRFNGELRGRLIAAVGEMVSAGLTKVDVAERLGLSDQTVSRYARKAAGAVATRPVRVRAATSARRLQTPSGFVIEGLTVSEIELLIRKLS